VRAILAAVARQSRLLLLVGLITAGVTALVLALTPRKYEGTMVLVPVQAARANAALAGAASFLGGSLDLGTTGFDAPATWWPICSRARTVLLAVADQPYQGAPWPSPS
jgi:hypothetical protein